MNTINKKIIENTLLEKKSFCIVGSMDLDNLGIIKYITENVKKILKFKKKDLIGNNIDILMTKSIKKSHNFILENYVKNYKRNNQNLIDYPIESFIFVNDGYIIPIIMFQKPLISVNNELDIIVNCLENKNEKNDVDYIIFDQLGNIEGYSYNIFNIFKNNNPKLNPINLIPFCPELEYLIDIETVYKFKNKFNKSLDLIDKDKLILFKSYVDNIINFNSTQNKNLLENIIKNQKLEFFFPSDFFSYYDFQKKIFSDLFIGNKELMKNFKYLQSIKNKNIGGSLEVRIKKLFEYLINDKNSFQLNWFCDLYIKNISITDMKFYILKINNFLKNQFDDYNSYINEIDRDYKNKNEIKNKKMIFKNIIKNKNEEVKNSKKIQNFYLNLTKNIFKLNVSIYHKNIYDYPKNDLIQNRNKRILFYFLLLIIFCIFLFKILFLILYFNTNIKLLTIGRISNDIINNNFFKFSNIVYYNIIKKNVYKFNFNELFNSTLIFDNKEIFFRNNTNFINLNNNKRLNDINFIFNFKEELYSYSANPKLKINNTRKYINNNLYRNVYYFFTESNKYLDNKISDLLEIINYSIYLIILKIVLIYLFFIYYYFLYFHLKKIMTNILFGFNYFNKNDIFEILEFNNEIYFKFNYFISKKYNTIVTKNSLDFNKNKASIKEKRIKKQLNMNKITTLKSNKIIIIFLIIITILFGLNILWLILYKSLIINNLKLISLMSNDNLNIQGVFFLLNLIISNNNKEFKNFENLKQSLINSLRNNYFENNIFANYEIINNAYLKDICNSIEKNKCENDLITISKNGIISLKSNLLSIISSNLLFSSNNLDLNIIKNNYIEYFNTFIYIENALELLIYDGFKFFIDKINNFTILYIVYNVIILLVFWIYFIIIFKKLTRVFFIQFNFYRSIYKHFFPNFLINREKRFRFSLKLNSLLD